MVLDDPARPAGPLGNAAASRGGAPGAARAPARQPAFSSAVPNCRFAAVKGRVTDGVKV
jgi:hypothetical protein